MNNDNTISNQEVKKELPDKNVDHDFNPEKAELKENNQSDCQSCNDSNNKI